MRLLFGLVPALLSAQGWDTGGWRAPISKAFPQVCWQIEDNQLRPVPGKVMLDLWSVKEYRDFDLTFEFKLDPGANGGIKYLVQSGVAGRERGGKWFRADATTPEPGDIYLESTNGLEFQVVDDATREAQNPKRRSGAMYSLVAPVEPPPIGPGVWHTGRIVVQGDRIAHYLNGKRVLAVTLGSPDMESAWDACERKDIQRLRALPKRESPIAITHHGTSVWYRNLRITAGR